MTSTNSSLLAIMVTGLIVTDGLTAIVLFVVGLVKRRPAFWATGLILGVVDLVAMVLSVMMPFLAPVSRVVVPPPALPTARIVSTFEECTGLPLPEDASVRGGATAVDSLAGTKDCLLALTVPGDFDAFLDANFKKATWQEVSPALTGSMAIGHQMWTLKDVQGAACYTLTCSGGESPGGPATGPEADGTWTTAIAYDAKTGQAYFVSARRPAGKQGPPHN